MMPSDLKGNYGAELINALKLPLMGLENILLKN